MVEYFITGTDTDVGKTVASAWLMAHLNAQYWKPIQSGLEEKDIDRMKAYTGVDHQRFFASTYELTQPLSPHESARRDGVTIDMNNFTLPETNHNLIIEGAGGLMVPINEDQFVIDMIAHLNVPAILVCRSGLGTINHTLLSIEALRARGIEIAGLIMSGPKSPHNRQALEEYSRVPIIAEIDHLDVINKESLLAIPPEIDLTNLKAVA
jgi:dethiobiotin synthase